jgi:general secretion pathway protein M
MKYLDHMKEYYSRMDQAARLRLGIGVSVVLLLIILFTTMNDQIAKLEKKRKVRESDLVEMMSLKQRYLSAKLAFQKSAGRLASIRADDSPAKIIEEIGIKGKSSRVTPLKGEERGTYREEIAEVNIEGLTANEAVNLLYKLEKGARPVLVKKANFKVRFDDPSHLDLILTVALQKPLTQGQK